jgi:hypothetical protein
MKNPDWSKEIVNQFIDSFLELPDIDLSFRDYLHTSDVIFILKKNRRILRFAVHGIDYMDIYISKSRYLYSSLSPDKLFYKHSFSIHNILNHFPNNNLIQFPNYKYYPNYEKMNEAFFKKKRYSNEERECIFKKTTKEHILFLKENLMPVIRGEMWIDEFLKQSSPKIGLHKTV